MIKTVWLILFFASTVIAQTIDKNYLLGKFDPKSDARFVAIDEAYADGGAKEGVLRQETYSAFLKMAKAAEADDVRLIIISATRSYESQKRIWENKWNGKVKVEGKDLTTVANKEERAKLILLYSSMPSTSRHHWGTDIDLNELENSYFESGEGLKIYTWLTRHADKYGFCQPYTSKKDGKRTGYEEEKWHWSYLPLSSMLLKQYKRQVRYEDIAGFEGSEVAKSIRVIEKYVEGVACK